MVGDNQSRAQFAIPAVQNVEQRSPLGFVSELDANFVNYEQIDTSILAHDGTFGVRGEHAVAELAGREGELRPDDKPKANANGIEEWVTDKGYHSGAVVKWVKSYEVHSYTPEKQQQGQRKLAGQDGRTGGN